MPSSDDSQLVICIYESSLDTGEVPEDWRMVNVVPLFKKGLALDRQAD